MAFCTTALVSWCYMYIQVTILTVRTHTCMMQRVYNTRQQRQANILSLL